MAAVVGTPLNGFRPAFDGGWLPLSVDGGRFSIRVNVDGNKFELVLIVAEEVFLPEHERDIRGQRRRGG